MSVRFGKTVWYLHGSEIGGSNVRFVVVDARLVKKKIIMIMIEKNEDRWG